MTLDRLGFAVRLMMFAAAVCAIDFVAGRWVAKARSYMSECAGGGPLTAIKSRYTKYDESELLIISGAYHVADQTAPRVRCRDAVRRQRARGSASARCPS
jgi:hypothetical protein